MLDTDTLDQLARVAQDSQEPIPIPSTDEILACQFHAWYSLLELRRRSLKSVVIDLPPSFLEYLGTDGVFLPSCAQDDAPKNVFSSQYGSDDGLSDNDYDTSAVLIVDSLSNDVANCQPPPSGRPDFPVLDEQFRTAIETLGGAVFCKTNWSAPLDAAWINAGSLKCQRTAELYLLLKSSDRTTFDLEHMMLPPASQRSAAAHGRGGGRASAMQHAASTSLLERPTLVLRKWANLNPAMEFRLFVRHAKLAGISQRDVTTCYDFLVDHGQSDEGEKARLEDLLLEWFRGSDDEASPDGEWLTRALGISSYSVDVYIDRRDRVYLIDINVFGYPSDPLLFNWDELQPCSCADDAPFRTVQSKAQTKPSAIVQGQQQGPIDMSLAPDFARFMQLAQEQNQNHESSSEED